MTRKHDDALVEKVARAMTVVASRRRCGRRRRWLRGTARGC